MKNWRNALVMPSATIRRAIEILDREALQIVFVVNERRQLVGTMTDGDVRRGLLKGVKLEDEVTRVMNIHPATVATSTPHQEIVTLMTRRGIRQCPIVESDGTIVSVVFLDELRSKIKYKNPVILMAGGMGSRLAPLTESCPKPLLKVGGKPIIKTIIDNFIDQGFGQFYISVNYKADMLKEYLGDGANDGVEIAYLEERKRLGTAGALDLLPTRPDRPFFVMNGDLLTKVSFAHMLQHHVEQRCTATMAVGEFDFQVPFGVVDVDEFAIRRVIEKPVHRYFVNAGIYCLEPVVLDLIAKDTYLDMPTLFERVIGEGRKATCFPVREYWIDIGRMQDFERANQEYAAVFRNRAAEGDDSNRA